MSVQGRAGSLIPIEKFARGGLWPEQQRAAETPALHRRHEEEPGAAVPSALHPRAPESTQAEAAPRPPATRSRPRKRRVSPAKDSTVDQVLAGLRELFGDFPPSTTDAVVSAVIVTLAQRGQQRRRR